jgi:NADPH-dependent curcumin reductase CurA
VEVIIVISRTENLHVEVDEKHTVEEASETRQYAEYKLIAATSVDINEPNTGNTVTAVHESNHKEFEKIDVQVCLGEL